QRRDASFAKGSGTDASRSSKPACAILAATRRAILPPVIRPRVLSVGDRLCKNLMAILVRADQAAGAKKAPSATGTVQITNRKTRCECCPGAGEFHVLPNAGNSAAARS